MMRNGNIFPIFATDANSIQVAYEWAASSKNKGVAIFTCKNPMPVYSSFEQTRYGLINGGFILRETKGSSGKRVVLAVIGDITLMSALLAMEALTQQNIGVRIVSIVSPRRLFRSSDIAWDTCSEPDGGFADDSTFDALFGGDAVVGMSSGPASMLEPLMLRCRAPIDVVAWKRGETTASAMQLLEYNGLGPKDVAAKALALLSRSRL
jgi:phosphoketolase